ncbi:LuxR family transcriptional regulator [Streptomyces sp. TP-A0874]|uniref:LuxR family transcriptional regulator n=1 Tax=Streptomyces sp. TP-A0874 TaxID=549819 RepID=UPI000A87B451|nr:LuxR family transcriptional regulator [Streptomyces sp. TP-A0874]
MSWVKDGLLPEQRTGRHEEEDGVSPAELGDDLEQALLEVRSLIETTVLKHRDRLSRRSLVSEVKAEAKAISAAAAEIISEATESVDVVLAGDGAPAAAVQSALCGLLEEGDEQLRVRVLCTQAVLNSDIVRCPLRGDGRLQVRIARFPMLAAVIVDGKAALACAESASGRRASVIRAPAVIRTLLTLFDGVWRNAVVATDRLDFGDRARAEISRRILEKLCAGVTDEVAARDLSVSVRTYRRYVAEIMVLLDASSRFQAGVRAAELGLLAGRPRSRGSFL